MYMVWKAIEQSQSFAVAHCNFGLRGSESDGDEAFVRSWCEARGVEFLCTRFKTEEHASANGISIEMAARELRYAWFSSLCEERGFEAVAVAHNANDNAETLILNLLRGTGSRGLRGMAGESIVPCPGSSIRLIRPILGMSREEIREWMLANGHDWREDHTNSENGYKRNKIRNEVFPIFSEINPSYIGTLNRDMAHFAQADDIVEDYYQECCRTLGCEGGSLSAEGINVRTLLGLRHWEYVLWRLLDPYHLSEETYGKLVALLKSGRTISGKAFQSPTHIISIRLKTLTAEVRKR